MAFDLKSQTQIPTAPDQAPINDTFSVYGMLDGLVMAIDGLADQLTGRQPSPLEPVGKSPEPEGILGELAERNRSARKMINHAMMRLDRIRERL